MKTEYEIRVLEVDKEEMIKKIEQLGATKVGEYHQRRYVYDFNPAQEGKWIRLRTNGYETTLAIKDIEKNTIDGTKEIEFKVDNFDDANLFLNQLGYFAKGYQENNRIQYRLNDVEIDIDAWPMIPIYMEIEGPDAESVNKVLEKLDVEKDKITALNCKDIYKNIYNIDISKIKRLVF